MNINIKITTDESSNLHRVDVTSDNGKSASFNIADKTDSSIEHAFLSAAQIVNTIFKL